MKPRKKSRNESYAQLLERRSYFESPTGCRICTMATTNLGYVQLRYQNGTLSAAHRVMWEEVHGPIPDGLHVLHHCDVRNCIEPSHLFLGTHQDNMTDKAIKKRGNQPKGSQHYNARINEAQVMAIRSDKRPTRLISAEYGITQAQVNNIQARRTWRHI